MASNALPSMVRPDSPAPEDIAFAEFRRSGSPDAMARVFDTTAPSLLLLVSHFTKDAAQAEDLIQVTFLQAMESADDFDGSRPVLPWLMSIVANRARDLIRREKLRVHDALPAELADARPGPAAITTGRETLDRITQAIATLPDTYRQILVYHLLHGLQPIEIAHAQGMAPETVRTKLRRGLQILRRSLPTSVALPTSAMLLSGQGLAAVRRGVLAAIPAPVLAPTAATLSGNLLLGVVLMKKLLIAVSVTLALVAAGVWSTLGGSAEGADLAGSGSGNLAASGQAKQAGAAGSHDVAASDPGQDAQAARTKLVGSDTGDALATVRGRCVDTSGVPIAGVQVRIQGRANRKRLEEYRKAHGEVEWTDPEPVLTGVDGGFTFRFKPLPPFLLEIALKRDGLLQMTGRLREIQPGEVKDFGDVEMRRGCRVRGILQDTRSAPVGKANISIRPWNEVHDPGRDEIEFRVNFWCTTQPNGSFEFDTQVPPDAYKLEVSWRDVFSPKRFVVSEDRLDWFVTVVVKSLADIPTIEGRIVDEDGAPVPNVSIETSRGRTHLDTSKRDGTFVLRKKAAGAEVRLRFVREGFEILEPEEFVPWGRKDLRIVMKRGVDLKIHVTDAVSGKPIEDYSVIAVPAARVGYSSRDQRPRNRGHHAAGVTVLRGMRRGRYIVLVVPKAERWQKSRFHDAVVDDRGPHRLDIGLHQGTQRIVRIETTQGKPVAGSRIELLQQVGSRPVSFETWAFQNPEGSISSSQDFALFRAEARTDAKGETVFTAPPGSNYVVRAHGPGHCPHVESGVAFGPGTKPLILRVSSGARLFGIVRPARFVKQVNDPRKRNFVAGFRLYGKDAAGRSQSLPAKYSRRFPILADGSFEIDGIPPGAWKLHLHWGRDQEFLGEQSNLKDGESRELKFDLARLMAGEVGGRVKINGKPAAGSVLTFYTEDSVNSRFQNFRLDGAGRYRGKLVPDVYAVMLQYRDGNSRSVKLPRQTPVSVKPGAKTEQDFEFHSGQLRVVVVGADGKPREGVEIRMFEPFGNHYTNLPRTDEAGVTRSAVKLSALHLFVWPKKLTDRKQIQAFRDKHKGDGGAWFRQRIKVGEVTASAGGETKIRVELPKSAGY